jgi:hypothetical protein
VVVLRAGRQRACAVSVLVWSSFLSSARPSGSLPGAVFLGMALLSLPATLASYPFMDLARRFRSALSSAVVGASLPGYIRMLGENFARIFAVRAADLTRPEVWPARHSQHGGGRPTVSPLLAPQPSPVALAAYVCCMCHTTIGEGNYQIFYAYGCRRQTHRLRGLP